MAISYITKADANANNNSAAITIPASVAVGDQLILVAQRINANAWNAGQPSGWQSWNSAGSFLMGSRVAQAGDAGSVVSLTATGAANWRALILVYRGGVAVGRPSIGQINAGGSLVLCQGGAAFAGCLFVGVGGLESTTARTFTYPAAATARSELFTNLTMFAFDEPAAPDANGFHPDRNITYTGGDVVNDRGSSFILAPTTGAGGGGVFKGVFG